MAGAGLSFFLSTGLDKKFIWDVLLSERLLPIRLVESMLEQVGLIGRMVWYILVWVLVMGSFVGPEGSLLEW